MKAFHYKTDGTITEIVPAQGKYLSLKECQTAIGGYMEIVPLTGDDENKLDDMLLICNEEGKLKNLPLNDQAQKVYEKYYGRWDTIVGDVIICDPGMMATGEEDDFHQDDFQEGTD